MNSLHPPIIFHPTSVCLSVCLLATLRKTIDRIFVKILPWVSTTDVGE